jgi:hypothetical protein
MEFSLVQLVDSRLLNPAMERPKDSEDSALTGSGRSDGKKSTRWVTNQLAFGS